jgi:Tfp pilus assembly protein PilZ
MKERRQHRRLPVIKDLAEPIEMTLQDPQTKEHSHVAGFLTNLSAGGMDLVLLAPVDKKTHIHLNMHLPGFDRFEVEGKLIWTRPKGATTAVGIQFSKIDKDHAKQLSHMADAYWECEDRITKEEATICFHGCVYWDLCNKPVKLKHPPKASNGASHKAKS